MSEQADPMAAKTPAAAPLPSARPRRPGADPKKVRQVEILISSILRIGVMVSLAVIIIGSAMSYVHHPELVRSSAELHRLTRPTSDFPRTIAQVWNGVRHRRGRAVIVAGLGLLIATPVVRVAVSILAFVYEKDPVFVIITSIVLALLLLSFFLGRIEG
ncbi:MAG TPA: DUF1634 domain-containing protein [Tepidisphaeraceae bacterium]|nr:DUF1634 domain-containing protein [Tepidisphaeraceae bacterium]